MSTRQQLQKHAAGFSLIELLVSMVIALVVTLAISSVLIRSEGNKRSTTSVNDVNQTGAYLAYVMDRTIRSAGSGFAQRWTDAFGCVLDASKGGAGILPLPAAASAPFNNMPLQVRVAPVMIGKGLADNGPEVRGDVLTVMGGTSGAGDMPQLVRPGSVAASTLRVTNALGYGSNDLVLLADQSAAGCMVQQIAPPPLTSGVSGDQVFFTGAEYSRNNGNVVNLAGFGASTYSIQIGSAPVAGSVASPPQMLFYGVGDNNTLFSFDLLRVNSGDVTPVADGVVEMRALYGVDTTLPVPDGLLDVWVDPVGGSGYSQAELTDGTPEARTRLRRIVAVRIGLILRTSLQERISDRYHGQFPDSTPPASLPSTTLTLFSDMPAALRQTRMIVGADNLYRYRTIEFTVPLRNTIYSPTS